MSQLTRLLSSVASLSPSSSQLQLEFSRELARQLCASLAFFPSFPLQLSLFTSLLNAAFPSSSALPPAAANEQLSALKLNDGNRQTIKALLEMLCVRLSSPACLVISIGSSPACRIRRANEIRQSQNRRRLEKEREKERSSGSKAAADSAKQSHRTQVADWLNGTKDCLCELTAAIKTGIDVAHRLETEAEREGKAASERLLSTDDLRSTIEALIIQVAQNAISRSCAHFVFLLVSCSRA